MKLAQYRKYKEIYQVNLDIIKKIIKDCDKKIIDINTVILKSNKKKQSGGNVIKEITNDDRLFMLIPSLKT